MERIFKLKFIQKIIENKNKEKKTEEFLSENIEYIKKLLYLYSSFDTYGLSYKDYFKYELFAKPENLKKKYKRNLYHKFKI